MVWAGRPGDWATTGWRVLLQYEQVRDGYLRGEDSRTSGRQPNARGGRHDMLRGQEATL